MAYLSLVSKTNNSFRIKIEFTAEGNTRAHRTSLSVSGSDGSAFSKVENHGSLSDGQKVSMTTDFYSRVVPGVTYTISGQLYDYWGVEWAPPDGWHKGGTSSTITVTIDQPTVSITGWTYHKKATSSSQNHILQINVGFNHSTFSNATYKLKYWVYDLTAGQTSDPSGGRFFSDAQFSENAHTNGSTHALSYRISAPPGHKMRTKAEIWQIIDGDTRYTRQSNLLQPQTDPIQTGPAGTWTITLTRAANNAINYTATFKQTSDDSYTWNLTLYLDELSSDNKLSDINASLSKNGIKTISGTTQTGLSYGTHWIYAYAATTGKREQGSASIKIDDSAVYEIINNAATLNKLKSCVINWTFTTTDTAAQYKMRLTYSTNQNQINTKATFDENVFYVPSGTINLSGTIQPKSGLTAETTYYYRITMQQISSSGVSVEKVSKIGSFVTGAAPTINLLKWSWDNDSGSWNAQESTLANRWELLKNSKKALDDKEVTTNFRYQIWNDLIDWVTYNLDQLDESYSSSDATNAKMPTDGSNKEWTATRYNKFKILFNKLNKALTGSSNNLINADVVSKETNANAEYVLFVTRNLNSHIDSYEE